MINVVHAYSKKWRFEANVIKCAIVVFRNEKTFDGELFWRNSALPHLDNYNYLGVKFTYNGHWDAHMCMMCSTKTVTDHYTKIFYLSTQGHWVVYICMQILTSKQNYNYITLIV